MNISRIDHVGIRISSESKSLNFYQKLGFQEIFRAPKDPVIVLKNSSGVEINLIVNAHIPAQPHNILMDTLEKRTGITHLALRISDIQHTLQQLNQRDIAVSQGPVLMGDGHVSIFVRDPDRNVIEFRGRAQKDTHNIPKYC